MIRKIIDFIHRISGNQFIKYLFVGGINTLFAYILFAIFIFLKLPYIISYLFGIILGVLFNFKTTGTIVFKSKSNLLVIKFFLVYSVSFIISNSVYYSTKFIFIHYNFFNAALWLDLIIIFKNINKSINWETALLPLLINAILVLPLAILTYFLNKKFVFINNPAEK